MTMMQTTAVRCRQQLLVFVIFALAVLVPVLAQAKSLEDRSTEFVEKLSQKAITLLSDEKISNEVRRDRFREILGGNFDTFRIGRFVMGPYWKEASAAQKKEYKKLFEQFLVETYVDRFENYSGQGLKVVGARQQGDKYVLVSTLVHDPESNAMVKVDWRVMGPNKLMIVDVIIEGVSMSLAQRSEFTSVIQREGGKVDALLAMLKEKIAEKKTAKND